MSDDTYVLLLQCVLDVITEGALIPDFELEQLHREGRRPIHALLLQYNRRLKTSAGDFEKFRYRLGTRLAREIEKVGTILQRPEDMDATCRIRRTVSEKKLLANRRNALRSTGPSSAHGKQTACQNSLKHGLSAREILLVEGEQPADFERHCSTLQMAYQPEKGSGDAAVRNIAAILWKLGRANRICSGFLSTESSQLYRSVHRHTSALSSELRNEVQLFTRKGVVKQMDSTKRTWDLRTDGFLWKQAIRHRREQEFRTQCEALIDNLQQSADRTDWQQLILHDLRAAAYLNKCHVAQVEAAQLSIAEYNAQKNIEGAEQVIREDARLASSWQNQDARDQTTKAHALYNREIFKSTELIKILERKEEPSSFAGPEHSPVLDQGVDRKPRRVK